MRRQWLKRAALALAPFWPGLGIAATATGAPVGSVREVALPEVQRVDAATDGGWLARDRAGRLWRVADTGGTTLVADGVDPTAELAQGHGRIAVRGLDGRLWVHDAAQPQTPPGRSDAQLAPHAGLCILPLAVIGVVEQAGRSVLARFEPDARGQWQVVARSREAVLPDAVPIIVDLDKRGDGGHIAVLAGPDGQRYPHAVLGDGIEATRVLWLERHSLEPLRSLQVDAPAVFEDRLLRPWRLPDGRQGLVTVQSGRLGAQLVVIAASPLAPARLELAASGPAIGTRNRWLSPASVAAEGGDLWAVHTPHIGGVLHRYRLEGTTLTPERVVAGLTNHRLGARDLDITARIGRWLWLPAQDWQRTRLVDVTTLALVDGPTASAPIAQCVASRQRGSAAVLSGSRLTLLLA